MGDYHDVTTERVGNRPPHKPAHVALPHKGLVWTGNGLVTTRSVCGIEPKHIGDTLTVEVRRFE